MKPVPGTPPATLGQLSRISDRITFLYLEHSIVHRDGNAITVRDERGVVHVPAATIASVMLGPGTTISHQAMMLLADSGPAPCGWVSTAFGTTHTGDPSLGPAVFWKHSRRWSRISRVGCESRERCTRCVSPVRMSPSSRCSSCVDAKGPASERPIARLPATTGSSGSRGTTSPTISRRAMTSTWPERDDGLPLRCGSCGGRGAGCSPALGFVHTGHDRSFVYDVADLYKVESRCRCIPSSGLRKRGHRGRRPARNARRHVRRSSHGTLHSRRPSALGLSWRV